MKYLWFFALMLISISGISQNQQAAYLKYPTLPPLNLEQFDKQALTKESLNKNQATLIMYFRPTCDHCQHQTEDMVKRMKDFKDIQIVMASYDSIPEMQKFYKTYKLDKYSNIKIGRDTKFTLPPFYKMGSLPYLALYDAKGQLIKTYEGNVKIDTLLNAFKSK